MKSNKLRKLICTGPKYYQTKAVNFTSAKNMVLINVLDHGVIKEGLSATLLMHWKSKVSECIEEKI